MKRQDVKPFHNKENAKRKDDYKSKSKKGKPGKSKQKEKELSDNNDKIPMTNDVNWYLVPNVTPNVANIPFGTPLGTQMHWFNSNVPVIEDYEKGIDSIPGIFAMYMAPSAGGESILSNNTLNKTANNLFISMNLTNGRRPNYDAADIVCMQIAAAQLYAFYAMSVRAYAVLQTYYAKNFYYARSMFEIMGFDYDDFKDKGTTFKWWLDIMAAKLRSIPVIGDLPMLAKTAELFTRIYKDVDIDKAQQYVFVPAYFWKYDPVAETTGTSLQPVFWVGNEASNTKGLYLTPYEDAYTGNTNPITKLNTLEDWVNKYQELITPFEYDSDIANMQSDILAAWKDKALLAIPSVNAITVIEPVYDFGMLTTIHNARFAPAIHIIKQVDGGVDAGFMLSTEAHFTLVQEDHVHTWQGLMKPMLDALTNQPSPEYVIEMTRCMPSIKWSDYSKPNDNSGITFTVIGTDVYTPVGAAIATIDYSKGSVASNITTYKQVANMIETMVGEYVDVFNMRPIQWQIQNDQNKVGIQGMHGEINCEAFITEDELTNIHNYALLGLFGFGKTPMQM